VPAINAPGQTTHVDLPQNVVLALERLRSTTPDPNDIKAQMVKAMITIIAKEHQLRLVPKSKGYKPQDLKKKHKEGEEPVKVMSDDEYSVVTPVKEKEKDKGQASGH